MWNSDKNYKFPISKKKKLKFQLSWLKCFQLLSYTAKGDQGAVCKYCTVFAHESGGRECHQKLNALVSKPLKCLFTTVQQTITKITPY